MSTMVSRKHSGTPNLLTINCECGHKILLLPDLKAMVQAIEEHVLDHKNKFALTKEETETLENALITQTFDLIIFRQKHFF